MCCTHVVHLGLGEVGQLLDDRLSTLDPFDDIATSFGDNRLVPGTQPCFALWLARRVQLTLSDGPETPRPTLPFSCEWALKTGSVFHMCQASAPSSPQIPAESLPPIWLQRHQLTKPTLFMSLPAELADGFSNLSRRRISV